MHIFSPDKEKAKSANQPMTTYNLKFEVSVTVTQTLVSNIRLEQGWLASLTFLDRWFFVMGVLCKFGDVGGTHDFYLLNSSIPPLTHLWQPELSSRHWQISPQGKVTHLRTINEENKSFAIQNEDHRMEKKSHNSVKSEVAYIIYAIIFRLLKVKASMSYFLALLLKNLMKV